MFIFSKKTLFCLIILLININHIFSQEKIYNKARKEIAFGYFQKALKTIEKGIQKYPDYEKFYLLLAQIYLENNQKELAINPLKKYYSLSSDPLALSEIGHIYFDLKKYNKATIYLQKYLSSGFAKDTLKILHLLNTAKFRVYAYSHPLPFTPLSLPATINTQWDEYFPDISATEKLFFTRRKQNEDIFFSQKQGNTWTQGRPFTVVNTQAQEGACTISPDGKTMIFTRCTDEQGCDLFITKFEQNKWTEPKRLPSPINTKYWESQPCLANNGNTLYFVSNRPGGKGKLDIWVVDLIHNTWKNLRNLSDSINTPGNEMSPYLHFDNQTLYFASDYLPGLGGYDIFFTRYIDNHWTKPINIGYPINSEKDDVRLIVSAYGDTALFSSRYRGNHDIYLFQLYKKARPKPTIFLVGKVINGQTHKTIKAKISIINLDNNQTYYSAIKDSFLISIPLGNFAFYAEKQGFTFASKNFSALDTNNNKKFLFITITLYPLKKDLTIKLHNIFFETNSYILKSESYTELKKLVHFLRNNPNINIEIAGHTDSLGSYEYNMNLSYNRAQSVAKYLIGHGINPRRIITKGYGFTHPQATNKTEKGRQLNRRVEIKILKI